MLQLANVVLIEGQRIAKDRRWIFDGIALRQPSPGRGCQVEQRNADCDGGSQRESDAALDPE